MAFGQKAQLVVTPLPEPTLDERVDRASRSAAAALSIFETVALDLEAAAQEFDAIAAASEHEAAQHTARMLAADEAADHARTRATKIKNLLA